MNRSGIVKGGLVAALFLFVSSYLRSVVFHSDHDHGIAFPSFADHWAEHGGPAEPARSPSGSSTS